MLKNYKVFIVTLAVALGLLAAVILAPHAKWKCPAGSGLVSGMCVPGATAPVRE